MAVKLEGVSYTYQPGTPHAWTALEDISLTIGDGERWGIIGSTGSGKSTLVQLMNGLLRPTRGRVVVDGVDLATKGLDLAVIRQKVGLVFQYPETQLFAETVREDLAFGPRNLGLSEARVAEQVAWAAEQVRLSAKLLDRPPFQLSGGEARRAAMAGILALQPTTLVLDEPMAGLDPQGRRELLALIDRLHGQGLTVIMVSHDMDDIAAMAERMVVMSGGRMVMQGTPREVFARVSELRELRLDAPSPSVLLELLARRGAPVGAGAINWDEAVGQIRQALARKGGGGAAG